MIELSDTPQTYTGGCMCCRNMVGLRELKFGSENNHTKIYLCYMCRTALVGQLIDVR